MDMLDKNIRTEQRIANQRNFMNKNTNMPVQWATIIDITKQQV